MSFPGGKNGSGTFQTIINQIPPHKNYIEAFLGTGAILRRKKPAKINIGIDLDLTTFENAPEVQYNLLIELVQEDSIGWLLKTTNSYLTQTRETFLYLDPPYLSETRKSKQTIYKHEMETEHQHRILINVIKDLNCNIMLSGYESELYKKELSDWRVIKYNSMTRGGKPAVEHLWMNYPEPQRLHDYSFLGSDFTDRQRIKRKAKRWINKFKNLPRLERAAILKQLDEIDFDNYPESKEP